MFQAIKEHLEDLAVDMLLKRFMPSMVAAASAWLAKQLHTPDGHQFFSPMSIKAILTLSLLAAHSAVHIWEKLKARAELAKQLGGKEGK